MTKIKKWTTIFEKCPDEHPTWKDIKHIQFEDEDRITISEIESISRYDEYYWEITVERLMEETDDEYVQRLVSIEKYELKTKWKEEIKKKQRYEEYLQLKKEFENGTSN